jgi:hypothetical protein
MIQRSEHSHFDELLRMLDEADIEDLEFSEQKIKTHSLIDEEKTGCLLIAVRGIPVPDPKLVLYVHASRPSGSYWYVLDHSVSGQNDFQEIVASSENEAKQIVRTRLRAAIGRMIGRPGK